MALSWGVDWPPTDPRGGGCSLFHRGVGRYRALAIQPVQIVLEILARHIVLEDLPRANFSLAGIGVFDAGHRTRLVGLSFLDKFFHALRIWLLHIRQSLRIASLPS